MNSNAIYYAQNAGGVSITNAPKVSQIFLVSQITKEAYIQSIDDDFMIAAFITLVGGIPILLLRARKRKTQRNISIQHE